MAISNLTGQKTSKTFQNLMQISSSGQVYDGLGNLVTFLQLTSSFASGSAGSGGAGFPFSGSAVITGSLLVSSSLTVTGSIRVSGSITGSLFGTSSFAISSSRAISSSFVSTASYAQNAQSASYATQALSASFAVSASLSDKAYVGSAIQTINYTIFTYTFQDGYQTLQKNPDIYWNSDSGFFVAPAFLGNLTGNVTGNADSATTAQTASYVQNAQSASYVLQAVSSSFATTASYVNPLNQNVTITGSLGITGSLRGNVSALSIASTTASLNLATNNFFTLTLANGANTHISASNILPGQTVNIRVTQGSAGTGTLSFNSAIKQSSGSFYTGSMIANAVDVVSLIAFDSTNAYISYINNFV